MPAISVLGVSAWLCSQLLVSWVVYREARVANYRSPLGLAAATVALAHILLFVSRSLLAVLLIEAALAALYLLVELTVTRRTVSSR
ncbi:sporulation control protein [Halovivax cerinus]|uniref:Sporulation control protein n=1 Tax=Halovivax cerinus TaxID=1487865 RepID=A0ABD5NQD3_9EURY|nr:sporulation control protein [Halovivax cerinus]